MRIWFDVTLGSVLLFRKGGSTVTYCSHSLSGKVSHWHTAAGCGCSWINTRTSCSRFSFVFSWSNNETHNWLFLLYESIFDLVEFHRTAFYSLRSTHFHSGLVGMTWVFVVPKLFNISQNWLLLTESSMWLNLSFTIIYSKGCVFRLVVFASYLSCLLMVLRSVSNQSWSYLFVFFLLLLVSSAISTDLWNIRFSSFTAIFA